MWELSYSGQFWLLHRVFSPKQLPVLASHPVNVPVPAERPASSGENSSAFGDTACALSWTEHC